MANKPIISHELLRQLVRFCPESGKYFWNVRPRSMFNSEGQWKFWNAKYADRETFTSLDGRGYCQCVILARHYNAHRVIWFYHTGEWPEGEIDHINGVPADNRIENLRVVTSTQNSKNIRRRRDNLSGITGVSWNPLTKTWRVRISDNRKQIEVGSFADKASAVAARKAAEEKFNYHPNHGRN